MLPLTILILNKNDPRAAIDSIGSLNPQEIIVGTYLPIKDIPGIKKVELKASTNYSKDLNELIKLAKTPWILYLKDNEMLLQSEEDLANLFETETVYGVQVLQEDAIIKEPRLWHSSLPVKFKNPVFEKLNTDPARIIKTIIYQNESKDEKESELLELWRKNQPLSIDACYYKAFAQLAAGQYQDFKTLISHYIFKITKQDIPSIMARYYLALIQGLVFNELQQALQNITFCVAENPLMAEFWCLLGDLHLKLDRFDKAKAFYENAQILGSRRLALDFWPMQISKYKTYPQAMIEKCAKVKANITQYQAVR